MTEVQCQPTGKTVILKESSKSEKIREMSGNYIAFIGRLWEQKYFFEISKECMLTYTQGRKLHENELTQWVQSDISKLFEISVFCSQWKHVTHQKPRCITTQHFHCCGSPGSVLISIVPNFGNFISSIRWRMLMARVKAMWGGKKMMGKMGCHSCEKIFGGEKVV